MGVGPIPFSAIARHVYGWRYDDADMFAECIKAMDTVYLELAAKKPEERGQKRSERKRRFQICHKGQAQIRIKAWKSPHFK